MRICQLRSKDEAQDVKEMPFSQSLFLSLSLLQPVSLWECLNLTRP